ENLQRKSLNGIDEAQALKKLMDEFNFTLDEMARVLGKDKTTIANTVRLLKLPVNIQEAVRQGVITSTQARTILGVNNEDEQKKIFYQIVTEKLSVREIEKRVQKKKGKKEEKDPFVIEVQDSLQKNLGTKVQIINKKKNKGKIVIEYYGLEDLERILKRIK
ncbi:MAG: ParB/RepB/Spo0J family partition protein, partial [Candidatus Omnitrophica bacterium]|nr:ParB/RepB/Spo0J family partition protein [Candidatus Omnitrophota bacterium]